MFGGLILVVCFQAGGAQFVEVWEVNISCVFFRRGAQFVDVWGVNISCVFFRRGAQFVEVWVDGFAFSDVSQRQDLVASQREELEKQKKQITKKKAPLVSPREQLEKEELLKMRTAVLKKVGGEVGVVL